MPQLGHAARQEAGKPLAQAREHSAVSKALAAGNGTDPRVLPIQSGLMACCHRPARGIDGSNRSSRAFGAVRAELWWHTTDACAVGGHRGPYVAAAARS